MLFRWIPYPSINNPAHTKPTLFSFRSQILHPNLKPSDSISTFSPHHSTNPNYNGLLYPYPKPCLTRTRILFELKPYPNPNNKKQVLAVTPSLNLTILYCIHHWACTPTTMSLTTPPSPLCHPNFAQTLTLFLSQTALATLNTTLTPPLQLFYPLLNLTPEPSPATHHLCTMAGLGCCHAKESRDRPS